uniref:Reverse transcriptase n=1 Tax=Cannabis sativa TaxID=3483 RepID=A0A803QE18_CANSA
MLFADDSYLYCRANDREASNVIRLLKTCEDASGQIVNFNKSSIFFSSNSSIDVRARMTQIMNIQEADGTSLYLGLPSIVGRNKKAILGFIQDKMQKRVHNWENRFLSKAGKEVLLKTVAQAVPSYAMDIRDYNLALLGKQAWRLLTEDDSLVCRVYKARYFHEGSFLSASLGNNPSFIWKSIFEAKSLIKAGARIRIGNGLRTNITTDPWLPDKHQPLITSSHPALAGNYVVSLMHINQQRWDVDIMADLFNDRDRALILGTPLLDSATTDKCSWFFETSGFYSTKSAYRFLQQNEEEMQQSGEFWKNFWQLKVPPKVLHFGWRAISGSLPTRTQFQTKHVNVNNLCPVCNNAEESIFHILVSCSFALSCWHIYVISIKPVSNEDFKDWFVDVTGSLKATCSTEVLMVAWQIWNARNDVLWKGRVKSAANVVLEARSYINQWLCAQKNRMEPILVHADQGWGSEHWTKPDMDTVKINVDGAIFVASNSFGFGFIARDFEGRIIEAVSKNNGGNVSPEIAEAYGIKEALSWIKDKGWNKVLVETDCLVVLQGIDNNFQLPSAFGVNIWDCKKLIYELNNISLKFVKRSANKALSSA